MKTCVFAGTFDPITVGHYDIVKKCAEKYQKVLVVIGQNPEKQCMLSESQRLQTVKKAFEGILGVEVYLYSSLQERYADFLKEQNATVYVRGIRNQKDLEFEKKMEEKNKKIYPFITTEYIWSEDYQEVSSSAVKQKIKEGKEFLSLIPQNARAFLQEILDK